MPCKCGYIAVQMRLYECVNVTIIGVLYDYMVLQKLLYEYANVTRNGVFVTIKRWPFDYMTVHF